MEGDGSTKSLRVKKPYFAAPVEFLLCSHSTQSDVMVTVTSERVRPTQKLRNGELRKIRLPFKAPKVAFNLNSEDTSQGYMVKERDEFFARLGEQREGRVDAESGAAVRIQALFRGFRCRKGRMKPGVVLSPKKENVPEGASQKLDKSDEILDKRYLRQELHSISSETVRRLKLKDRLSKPPPKINWKKRARRKEKAKVTKKRRREHRVAAAIAIQRIIRGYLAQFAFSLEAQMFEDELRVYAAIQIQRIFRGLIGRRTVEKVRRKVRSTSACRIQTLVRGVQARMFVRALRWRMLHANLEDEAAVYIQCVVRGGLVRRRAMRVKEDDAALLLQSAARGYRARKAVEEKRVRMNEASSRVQAGFRGMQARRRVEALKRRRGEEERERAVLRIQAHSRGHAVRSMAKRERRKREEKSAVHLQSAWRGFTGRKTAQQRRIVKQEHLSAAKIQSIHRQKMAARRVEDLRRARDRRAATLIQASYRGRKGRVQVESRRRDAQQRRERGAAVAIQRTHRMRLARNPVMQQRLALRGRLQQEALKQPLSQLPRRRWMHSSWVQDAQQPDPLAAVRGHLA